MKAKTIRFGLLLVLIVFAGNRSLPAEHADTYRHTRRLLSEMASVTTDSDKLAALFKLGDERIHDLIRALDDADSDISLRAQIVIRYLGNGQGMERLQEWYGKQPKEYRVAGPIPLPLMAWDYEFIERNLIGTAPSEWRERGVQYLYALAMDESKRSQLTLNLVLNKATAANENTFVYQATRRIRTGKAAESFGPARDLARLVRENAFFMSDQDRRLSAATLLALNSKRDKALIEVEIDRGDLAEEWYHVVIRKTKHAWKFFSITQVAIS